MSCFLYDWDSTEETGLPKFFHTVRRKVSFVDMTPSTEILNWHQMTYESSRGAQVKVKDYFRPLSSYKPDEASYPMEDVLTCEQDAYAANPSDDIAWGREEIVNPAHKSTIATSEVGSAFGVKCRSAGVAVPVTLWRSSR